MSTLRRRLSPGENDVLRGHGGCVWIGTILLVFLAVFSTSCQEGNDETPWGFDASRDADVGPPGDTDNQDLDADSNRVDATTFRDGADGESYCGRPDQVITTIEAAEQLGDCDVYRGSFEFGPNTVSASEFERLPELRVIEGELNLGGFDRLAGFDRLERVGALDLLGMLEVDSFGTFSNLRVVQGQLSIEATGVSSLRGLHNLKSTGSLYVGGNKNLESLEGLAALERIREWVTIKVQFLPHISTREAKQFVRGIEVGGEVRIHD